MLSKQNHYKIYSDAKIIHEQYMHAPLIPAHRGHTWIRQSKILVPYETAAPRTDPQFGETSSR